MSGVNVFCHESDCNYRTRVDSFEDEATSVFVANYDYRTIDLVDPLVRVLRDKPYHISPVGEVFQEFYDNIATRRDRGVPFTPVALLFDRRHGCTLEYNENAIYNAGIPFGPGEYMFRATFNTLFPWEEIPAGTGGSLEARTMVTGPFGDVFDSLTGDASLEVMQTYPVIMLIGRVDVDGALAAKLKQYVEAGGVLVVNSKQLSEFLTDSYFGCHLTGKALECTSSRDLSTNESIGEEKEFEIDEAELLEGTEVLIAASKASLPRRSLRSRGTAKERRFSLWPRG